MDSTVIALIIMGAMIVGVVWIIMKANKDIKNEGLEKR